MLSQRSESLTLGEIEALRKKLHLQKLTIQLKPTGAAVSVVTAAGERRIVMISGHPDKEVKIGQAIKTACGMSAT